ncbi:hypothetical protein [Cohnella sp. GCM10027633]|uniref:hypothetical protein n=1 Tax=unclassified Cohnella TaxID=2636738 RepID=UPI00363D47C4
MNLVNVVKSFFLGLFLGVVLLFYDSADATFKYRALTLLASGSIGFVIGLITEWLTAILPISLARARMYFLINNLIALGVTTILMGAMYAIASGAEGNEGEFVPVLFLVLGIICIANLFDYAMYRRAQKKLRTFKASHGEPDLK